MPSQRGSMLLDTVLFMALMSVFFMTLMGQLTFMMKVSAGEDARVQGLMAARMQTQELRTTHTAWDEDDLPLTDSLGVDILSGFDRLSTGQYRVTKFGTESGMYQVEVWVNDRSGNEVYRTQTEVWVKP